MDVIFDPSDNVAIVKDVVGHMTASPAALLPWYWDEFDSFPVANRQVRRPNRPSRGGTWQILFQSLSALHHGWYKCVVPGTAEHLHRHHGR